MALNRIPIISPDVSLARESWYRSLTEYTRFIRETKKHLKRNPVLYDLIEGIASQSSDPGRIREVSYALLDLINAQLEVDNLNREGR